MTLPEYVGLLRPTYNHFKLPFISPPYFIVWVLVHILGLYPGPQLLKASWGPPPQFDCSKARLELGLDFISMRQSANDMAERLLELGIVKSPRVGP
jgi:hypothetical protein